MTYRQDNTAIMTVLEIINSNGLEGLGEAVFILINEVMKIVEAMKIVTCNFA